jgi:hypothetical protein
MLGCLGPVFQPFEVLKIVMIQHYSADLMSTAVYVLRRFNHASQPELLAASWIAIREPASFSLMVAAFFPMRLTASPSCSPQ